ncbi:hypothetical protein [uncultured Rhodospira sp.]|uniref:hypothetical protein n=1 Tax=uncultured Rhodospira sp. TaxID=1936189 RepID=UPI0026147ACC|nr:hypothetical protein [uncultured Rhodospira sp.]
MATKVFGAAPLKRNTYTVTALNTTEELAGSNVVNVVIDDTLAYPYDVLEALDAIARHLKYQFSLIDAPSGLPTSGSRVE